MPICVKKNVYIPRAFVGFARKFKTIRVYEIFSQKLLIFFTKPQHRMRSASPERIRDECKKSRLVSVIFFFFVNAAHFQCKYAIIRFSEHGTFGGELYRLLFDFCFVVDSAYTSYHTRVPAHGRVYSIKPVVVDTPRHKWFSGIRGKKIRRNQRKGQTKPACQAPLTQCKRVPKKYFPEFNETTFLAHPRRWNAD